MTSFSIIGAGNLGANLAHSLRNRGYTFNYIYKKSKYPDFNPMKENDLEKIVSGSDIIFISVQESRIGAVVKELTSVKDLSGKIFLHTANSLTSEELHPLKQKGGHTGSFSPLQTFSRFSAEVDIFKGVYFLCEGDRSAMEAAESMAEALNSLTVKVDRPTKAFFHIGAVISSNFLNSLLRFADLQVKKGGGCDYRVLLPLVRRTLKNIEEQGLEKSLTGPVSRGESGVIETHLTLLEGKEKELYALLNGLLSDRF